MPIYHQTARDEPVMRTEHWRSTTIRAAGPAMQSGVLLAVLLVVLAIGPADGADPAGGRRTAAEGTTVDMSPLVLADWIDRDRRFEADKPAKNKSDSEPGTEEVTTAEDAAGGCDGVKAGRFGFHVASGEKDPWWQVDLGRAEKIDRVVIYNRTDAAPERTRNIQILVSEDGADGGFRPVYRHDGQVFFGSKEEKPLEVRFDAEPVTARIVRLQVPGRCSLALEEIEVYGPGNPGENLALNKPADQISTSPYSRRAVKKPEPVAATTPREKKAEFSRAHIRQVIKRGHGLIARLRPTADARRLEPLAGALKSVEARWTVLRPYADIPLDVRREFYLEACRLVREIAFTNPLLNFDRILFVKRHDPGGLYHMVHQYYGFSATPGGGLFVLEDPFSSDPKVIDLLADATVENGRLKGQRLVPGTFVSPEVSYDGKTVLFAYTQGLGEKPEWSPRSSYHMFQVNADGTGLVQLTDGPWNDFDPCFLPGGRIAFISERRGGYLRCGGSAPPWDSPTYTLYSMEPDGSDVVCLSFHETHEWHPSVDNNGMLIYCRWDYVDRDTNVAHHLWSCFPDGRDPRSYHGNYPVRRESRPWMEMSARAIAGSNRFVATAAAHHGQAFGSLVLIDYRPEDDNAMSQVERVTPDVPMPESEGGKPLIRERMAYGTAWPLSEDDYLCVYSADAANRGVYWIDRDGNRELLYRDSSVSCLSPIPLRSRPRPPILPEKTTQTATAARSSGRVSEDGQTASQAATVTVMNVYDADFQWPEGTQIEALRVVQVLPKTTPPVDQPRIGIATETNARAVLGTVPVEADGSAHFEAPVGKLVFFQALDARGMAVQSMRSATYVHPGERLVCQGCHERKHTPPSRVERIPLAVRRPPSKILPDVEGSNPFSYPRLVQPVLDRHCVECHREEKALDLSGVVEGKHGWTRSYANLSKDFAFYFTVSNGSIKSGVHGGSRTTAGKFGARASRLLEYLGPEHYDVELSGEDLHRITLWLDCNSEFYGSYHSTDMQARGEIVLPTLD